LGGACSTSRRTCWRSLFLQGLNSHPCKYGILASTALVSILFDKASSLFSFHRIITASSHRLIWLSYWCSWSPTVTQVFVVIKVWSRWSVQGDVWLLRNWRADPTNPSIGRFQLHDARSHWHMLRVVANSVKWKYADFRIFKPFRF